MTARPNRSSRRRVIKPKPPFRRMDTGWPIARMNRAARKSICNRIPPPGEGGRSRPKGGEEPVWNPNGRELFYRSRDKMMAVDIATQPSLSAGKPRMLFSSGLYLPGPNGFHFYDVSPDGQRFLMIKQSEEAAALTQIVVVQNWFEELKQKVPTGKK